MKLAIVILLCFVVSLANALVCDNSIVPKVVDCSNEKATFCKLSPDNTLCKYCGVDLAVCSKVCDRGLTRCEEIQILDLHNDLRRQVAKGLETRGVGGPQPKASNMNQLIWDPILAKIAQR